MVVFGLVKNLAWQESINSLLVDGLILLAKHFSVDFAAYQPLRSQYSHVILCLDFNCGLPPS